MFSGGTANKGVCNMICTLVFIHFHLVIYLNEHSIIKNLPVKLTQSITENVQDLNFPFKMVGNLQILCCVVYKNIT